MNIYAVGSRVKQAQYGLGTVTVANDRHTVIDFDLHGVRTFVTTMVTLESTTEAAPPRAKGGARAKREPRKQTK